MNNFDEFVYTWKIFDIPYIEKQIQIIYTS